MHCHKLVAAVGNAHDFVPVTAFTEVHTGGPIKLGAVVPSMMQVALAASSLWNAYLPESFPTTTMNVTTANLPGMTVGQIWIPCAGSVCNITIDPSYAASYNVLVHEFGHGLGLPYGAVSSKFPNLKVDESNHWAPATIDPSEIMTAILDPHPYLAKYTLDAISGGLYNHSGCNSPSDCQWHIHCAHYHRHAPGQCTDHPCINCNTTDDYWTGIAVFCILLFTFVPLCLLASPL